MVRVVKSEVRLKVRLAVRGQIRGKVRGQRRDGREVKSDIIIQKAEVKLGVR